MKKLLLSLLALAGAEFANAQCNELFFSEYVEGSGNDKGVEIYNPTANPINLSDYRVVRYSNGSQTPTDSLQLSGTINAYDVWVVINGQTTGTSTSPAVTPALQALADQLDGAYPAPTYMNGDDAIALVKTTPNRTIIDIIGKIGEDPGASWTDVFPYTDAAGAYWTKDHTLQRKASVTQGVTVNPTAFNPTTEWDSLPKDTWTGLGAHTCNCFTGVNEQIKDIRIAVYPNPAESNGKFIVSAGEVIERVEIYNALGQVVYTMNGNKGEQKLSVSTEKLNAGLYFVRTTFANDRSIVTKINIR